MRFGKSGDDMAREGRDDDLTEADRQVMRLYDDTKKPIDWDASDDAILFSMNDAPVLKPFGLYREEGAGRPQLGM